MGRKKAWPPRPHPHRASGQERVLIGGRHHYLGPIGSPEARQNYASLIAGLAENRPPPEPVPKKARNAGLTVGELVEKWNVHARARYDPAGREAKQFVYSVVPLVDLHRLLPVRDFDANRLEEVRDEMVRRGWSHRVVGRRVTRIRTVWRWACRKGLAPAGAWEKLRELEPLAVGDRRVKKTAPRQACTWADLARTCRFCAKVPRDMLLFCWFSGARPGEVRKMRVGEVDVAGPEWTFRPAAHKNAWRGQDRAVAIGPRAQKVLGKYLAGRPAGAYVFESGPGRCYRDDSFARAVARARERAGVAADVIPYVGRHACKRRVTRALGLDAARAVLGQASLDSTNGYDAIQDEETARQAARRLG